MKRIHLIILLGSLFALQVLCSRSFCQNQQSQPDQELVGHTADHIVTPVNQILTPFGKQLDLPGMRPQALAISRNGKILAVSGKTNKLVIVDSQTLEIKQQVAMPGVTDAVENPKQLIDDKAQVSFTGLVFSHDDKNIFLSDVNGSIKVFRVENNEVFATRSIALPPANAPRRAEEIPSGLAISDDDRTLYVCANLSNQVLAIDIETGNVTRQWKVGVAPYDIILVRNHLFVSNWGGRVPGTNDLTGPAGRGTNVRVDSVRHIASEGSVSIIDLKHPESEVVEVVTGKHASGLAASPDKRHVVCANAADDYLSIIDVEAKQIVKKIWTKVTPTELFGAGPNAVMFSPDGRSLFVANGSQNAIAVIEFEPEEDEYELIGLIPVGWYPGALQYDSTTESIFVANIKGLPKTQGKDPSTGSPSFNSHQYSGSISKFQVPDEQSLADLSEKVSFNMRAERIAMAMEPARADQPTRAIPERIGEPSLIKHVVYIIKENRTYDQVFGSLPQGNGDPSLCIFGREITPNQHKLVEEFVLLDNTYCAGILSADGHQWSTTAITTDYMEKSFAGFPRSYPDGMGVDEDDALAYSPAGFIWDNAVKHGVTIRNYGEFMMPLVRYRDVGRKESLDFLSCYRTWQGLSEEVIFECAPSVESLRPFSPTSYVGWEMAVPDQFRADFVIRELEEFTAKGEYPQFTIICLPNDHASGTRPGFPTPASHIADNDLAFGRIVEAYSKSPFWKDMAIFAIEDDPQAGWDHVSGYRTTAYVVSPYANRSTVVSTQYNTISILRTIEQILGLPPMNQFDASALPMSDCFVNEGNFKAFEAVPANIPLDQLNPEPSAIHDVLLKEDAIASMQMNFKEVDRAPEDLLNRILWRAMKGSQIPYPDWAISAYEDDDDDDHLE